MGQKPGTTPPAAPMIKKKVAKKAVKANPFAKKAANALSGKGDIGKPNNDKTTGFSVVANKAAQEYGSQAAGSKVAGAILAKMRAKK